MARLLQGDVGSGKTIVAGLAILLAAKNGAQAALMAPTEILAEQHAESLASWLTGAGVRLGLLTGRVRGAPRRHLLAALAAGSIDALIGTHALVESPVKFRRLGLVVVDEQHRFGVAHRSRLFRKGDPSPHVLIMTATPIPRSLAWAIYGELDVSVLDEKPPGRSPVVTRVREEAVRDRVYRFAGERAAAGERVYVVVPAIEEGAREVAATRDTAGRLSAALPGVRVGVLHGRMPPAERQAVLADFAAGRCPILVSTTVVEVGVDVPEATLMIVENAESFGLAQLHQLRGRVGRSARPSWCALVVGRSRDGGRAATARRPRTDVRRISHRREGPRGARPRRPPRDAAERPAVPARRGSAPRPRPAAAGPPGDPGAAGPPRVRGQRPVRLSLDGRQTADGDEGSAVPGPRGTRSAPEVRLKVLVTGGTGFVGTHLVNRLLHRGHAVAVLARSPEKTRNRYNRPVEAVSGDVLDPASLAAAAAGREALIHLVGIINEKGNQTFDRMHREATENAVAAAKAAGIRRYLHMSAMGSSEDSPSAYGRTKAAGEKAVRASGLDWTIFRPSIIFGPGRRVRFPARPDRQGKPGLHSGHRARNDALPAGLGLRRRPRLRRRSREAGDHPARPTRWAGPRS